MRVLALALASTAAVLTSCAKPVVSTAADAPASSSAPDSAAADVSAKPAKLGDTITLKGVNPGEAATVTLVKVLNLTKGGQFDAPDAGTQFAAAQFRVKNSGSVPYSDSPSNGAKVLDASGQQFDAQIVTKIAAGPLLPASVKLAPGGQALGYIAFQVPKGTKLTGVQFSMNSGFGSTAEWKLV